MIANRLMIASAAVAIVVFVGTSAASAFDSHKRGGDGHIGRSGAATGRTVAAQGYAGRHRAYGRYAYGRYGYRAPGTGIGPGLAGWGWGYPGYTSSWAAGNCPCRGHFTSGTAGAW
jgi:hypothetical protein